MDDTDVDGDTMGLLTPTTNRHISIGYCDSLDEVDAADVSKRWPVITEEFNVSQGLD